MVREPVRGREGGEIRGPDPRAAVAPRGARDGPRAPRPPYGPLVRGPWGGPRGGARGRSRGGRRGVARGGAPPVRQIPQPRGPHDEAGRDAGRRARLPPSGGSRGPGPGPPGARPLAHPCRRGRRSPDRGRVPRPRGAPDRPPRGG